MAKISASLRKKLLKEESDMGSSVVITNSKFTKMRLRILPPKDLGETPGTQVTQFYCKSLSTKRKGSISPRTFGKRCPVFDAIDMANASGDKEAADFAANGVNVIHEFWVPVIDRADPGTPESPKIRVWAAKKSAYQQVLKYMTDEDDGEDITDPVEGRDIRVKKTGAGLNTEWTVNFLDTRTLGADDEEMQDALIAASAAFDVQGKIFKVDYDILAEIYELLTGETMPDSYRTGTADDEGDADYEDEKDADTDGDDDDDADDTDDVDETDDGEDAASEVSIAFGETRAEFESEDGTVQGIISGAEKDEDGDDMFLIDDGSGEEPWSVPQEDCTILEDEEPETEPEPEPAPRRRVRKPAKKVSKKVAKKVAKKIVKKPAATKGKKKPVAKKTPAKKGKKKLATRASSRIRGKRK